MYQEFIKNINNTISFSTITAKKTMQHGIQKQLKYWIWESRVREQCKGISKVDEAIFPSIWWGLWD